MISDFHCHLIPAVDDGAENLEGSRRALRAMSGQGVRRIITSPHFDGFLTRHPLVFTRRLEELDAGWAQLDRLAREEFPDLRLERGAEVMLNLPDPDLSDARLRLAGGSFVLLEFPGMAIPPNSTLALERIVATGVTPIVAHPERYVRMKDNLQLASRWIAVGARLQVNYGSLTGAYGASPRAAAELLIRRGMASYLATDYHARGTPPIPAAREVFAGWDGLSQFELLSDVNPGRIFESAPPLPVTPIQPRRSWLRRRKES